MFMGCIACYITCIL